MTDDYLTVAEIATVLKLNQQTIRNWIDAGKLPALHLGRRVRVKRSDFEQLLREAELPNGAPKDVNDGSPSIWEGHIPMPEVPATRNAHGSFGARHKNGVE